MNTLNQQTILEIDVANHPGVMSHICGLIARRAFNMDAILCTPMIDSSFSKICILISDVSRLPQLIKQIQKLHDVVKVLNHQQNEPRFQLLNQRFICIEEA